MLNPVHRGAGTMNTEAFSTTFDPAHLGILDTVEQILLPSLGNSKDSNLQCRKLRAKLYTLNVCFYSRGP